MDGVEVLERAERAVERGEYAAALLALLDAWREVSHPRLAALIEAVSPRIERPALGGKKAAERNAQWLETAAAADPLDVERLLSAAWPGKHADGSERIRALRAFPRDPRIAAAVTQLITSVRYTTNSASQVYNNAFDVVLKAADPRSVEPLRAADPTPFKFPSVLQRILERGRGRLKARLTAAELPPAAEPVVDRLERQLLRPAGARSEAELLAAVYAHPRQDAPRRVLADHWLGMGLPQGELLALQLDDTSDDRKVSRRERALLKEHRSEWIGGLRGLVNEKQVGFRRGFPADVVIDRAVGENVVIPPEAALIERATLARDLTVPHRLLKAMRPSLEVIVNVGYPNLKRLCDATEPWNLTSLSVLGILTGTGPALENLRHLGVRTGPGQNDWLWDGPMVGQLSSLTLLGAGWLSPHGLEEVETRAPDTLHEVHFLGNHTTSYAKPADWTVTLRRDARGRFGALTARFDRGHYSFGITGPYLARDLARLPDDALTSVEITKTRAFKPTDAHREQLQTAADRFRLERFVLP